jgi:hypothetical protein
VNTFHCTACQALVFFENTRCLRCGRTLAFAPQRMAMLTLSEAGDGQWRAIMDGTGADGTGADGAGEDAAGALYRLCRNYREAGVCNWLVRGDATDPLCDSCGLTHTIPDQSVAGNPAAWAKLEAAKRRVLYSILSLRQPLVSKRQDAERGLEFRFLSDEVSVNGDRSRVLTGHDNGVITINVAEADDVYREGQRQRQHEPYRTLLGHFRHEIGHYYWDRLIQNSDRLEEFRRLFGDERRDYQAALKQHYEQGAPAGWEENYISAYATTHPWEDWAESWAHLLHMVDALETAHAVGLSVNPSRRDEPALSIQSRPTPAEVENFDVLVNDWFALTYVLNNLTRGLGLADAYPFVLSATVIEKLRFVCRTMT